MKLSAMVVVVAVVTMSAACDNATIPENPTRATQVSTGPGNTFNPRNVTIAAGDTVIFIVGTGHNVTFTTPGSPAGCVGVCPTVFQTKGTFNYVCTPHAPGMAGTITVQ